MTLILSKKEGNSNTINCMDLYIMRNAETGQPRPGKRKKRPRINVVAPERFREARLTCFLNVAAAAKLLRVTEKTLHNWETGKTRIPYAAYKLMRIMRGGELPGVGDSWAGWQFTWNEVLISPEGHRFKPHEFSWLHLLIEQAKFWQQHRKEHHAKAAAAALVRKATESAIGFQLPASIFNGPVCLSAEPNPYTQPAPVQAPAPPHRWRQMDGTQASYSYRGVSA